MITRKRKIEDSYETNIIFFLDEIKNILRKKNIFIKEEFINDGINKDINIYLTDKNNNYIGEIKGGIGEFPILENGQIKDVNSFSISWLNIEKQYQGYKLGTFLIIYIIFLCKNKFNDINYIVLDDDSDEINPTKNIYIKLGFIYQETKEVKTENGQIITVASGAEMQLKISDFFNDELLDKLKKIIINLKNWNKNGGKSKKIKKVKKSKKKTKKVKKIQKR